MNQNLNAGAFLNEIKKLRISGKEFLELIGNSKISNSAYNEIKESEGLTQGRLIELLEGSPLASADFARLLSDAQTLVNNREKVQRRDKEEKLGFALNRAERRLEEQERLERFEQSRKYAQLLAEARVRAKEERIAEKKALKSFKTREISKLNTGTREVEEIREETVGRDAPVAPPDERGSPLHSVAEIAEEKKSIAKKEEFVVKIPDYPDLPVYEDDEEYTGEEAEEINRTSVADNKGKLLLCLIMAIVLVCGSFAVRWAVTGSFWLEREQKAVYTIPETYRELSQRLAGAGDTPSEIFLQSENYSIAGALPEAAENKTLHFNSRYIFKIFENTLYVVEFNQNGLMVRAAEIDYADENVLGMYLHEHRLYVITEGEYEGSYHHLEESVGSEAPSEPLDAPSETPGTILISDDFVQKTAIIRAYNALEFNSRPTLELSVDGEFDTALFHKNKFIAATHFTPHEPLAYSDLSAFVPSFSVRSGERQFINLDDIFTPPAKLTNPQMTVISVIENDEARFEAVTGGAGSVYAGMDSLFVTQSAAGNTRLTRLDLYGMREPEYHDISGTVPVGAVSEWLSILRVGAHEKGKSSLYLFNSDLDLLTRVINIGAESEEPLKAVLFHETQVYFIADKLYAFDASQIDEVFPAEEVYAHIYADYAGDFYRISDRERLEIAVEVDADGQRAGIRLNIHKLERGETKIVSTFLITAESNVAGNWNPFLFADTDGVFVSENGSTIIVPVKYFNSISNIEKMIVFDYNEFAGLTKRNEIVYYDINREIRRAVLVNGVIYSFWDKMAVSANEADAAVIMKFEL